MHWFDCWPGVISITFGLASVLIELAESTQIQEPHLLLLVNTTDCWLLKVLIRYRALLLVNTTDCWLLKVLIRYRAQVLVTKDSQNMHFFCSSCHQYWSGALLRLQAQDHIHSIDTSLLEDVCGACIAVVALYVQPGCQSWEKMSGRRKV